MKNAANLNAILARIWDDKPLLDGEKQILTDALQSLVELTDMVNDQCGCRSTGAIPIITLDDNAPGRP